MKHPLFARPERRCAHRFARVVASILLPLTMVAVTLSLSACSSSGPKSEEAAEGLPPANPDGMTPDEETLRQVQRERAGQRAR